MPDKVRIHLQLVLQDVVDIMLTVAAREDDDGDFHAVSTRKSSVTGLDSSRRHISSRRA